MASAAVLSVCSPTRFPHTDEYERKQLYDAALEMTVQSVRSLTRFPPTDEHERKQLYDAVLEMMYKTESPQDTAQRLYHSQLPLATTQIGMDLKLFKFLAESPDSQFSTGELAQITGTDPFLLYRLLRYYAAHGMIRQASKDTFAASNITHNLSLPGTAAGIKHYWLTMTPCYNAMPKFFAENAYKNPVDRTPFNTAFKTDLPVFKWREENPENAKAGQEFMAAQRIGQRSVWDGLVPMHDFNLSSGDLAAGRVLMCDVGGGSSHQCAEFRKYHPEIQGSIVTEDLPTIQALIKDQTALTSQDISLVPHDFMDVQPIKGAKIYYLRNVIHNWNDDASRVILSQIAQAMAEDSVVVIDDVVLPESSVTWKQSNMDLAMMTMLAAMERDEDHFARLLKEAGLKLRDVWQYDRDYGDSFVVAVLDSPEKTTTNGTNGIVNDTNGVVNDTNGVVNDMNGVMNVANGEHVANGESVAHVPNGASFPNVANVPNGANVMNGHA